MKNLLLMTIVCVLSMGLMAEAQVRPQRVTNKPIATVKSVATSKSDIPVFKVTPGEPSHQYKESDLQFLNRNYTSAKAIPKSQKIDILKSGGTQPPSGPGGIQNNPELKLTHLKMSAKNPFKGVLGFLEFNEVRHYYAKKDYVLWYIPSQSMGFMKAHLKVEKGAKYLVDWNVGCDAKRKFHFSSTGGSQTTELNKGSHHLLAILEPQETGMTSLMLWADVEWVFYGMEISKME